MHIHVFHCFLVLLWQGKITFYLKQEKNIHTNMFQKTFKMLKFVKCFWDISDESDDEDHPDGLQFNTEPVVPTVITTVTTVITSVITQLCRQIPHSLICYKVSLMRRPSIFTVRNSSCGKVMFSQACIKNSVDGGGCLPHFMLGYTDTDTPLGRPPLPPPETATAANGTYLTGMHSC